MPTYSKPPLSLDQQVELLITRGLTIQNTEKAKLFLKVNNYYRLNAYFHKFLYNNHFENGVSIDRIISIYSFDKTIRHKILLPLENVEIQTRSYMAFYLAHKYGACCLYDNDFCHDENVRQEIRHHLINEGKRRNSESFVKHFTQKYDGIFPIWVAIELFTFGMVSKLFSNLKYPDQRAISRDLYDVDPFYLKSWIYSLSTLRNICAHYGHLFKRKFVIRPSLLKDQQIRCKGNDSLFCLLIILNRLTGERIDLDIKDVFHAYSVEPGYFTMMDYGFPD